jgi:tRNA1Val (adenine37-N6)-methyltransferase
MSVFHFKHFNVIQEKSALKVGTDALLLGALIELPRAEKILEIGSGTGVISLMVAQRTQSATIDALEIDELAASETKENFLKCPWTERLKVHHCNFFSWSSESKYDLIFSNPPFYMDGLLPSNNRLAQSKHVQFDFMKFLEKASSLLTSTGSIWLIIPSKNFEHITKIAVACGLNVFRLIRIQGKPGKPTREVIAFSKEVRTYNEFSLLVRNDDGSYSDQYKELTLDFHDRKL